MIKNYKSKYSKYKSKYLLLKQHMIGSSIVKVMDNIVYNKQLAGGGLYEELDPDIKLLLNNNLTNDRNHQIVRLKKLLNKYIATPWGYNDNIEEYWKKLNFAKQSFAIESYAREKDPELSHINDLCRNPKDFNNIYSKHPENFSDKEGRLCSAHGGNLFEHSQWSALQVLQWFDKGDTLVEDLDLVTCIIAAFFHDIGKGADCIYNMYSDDKYLKKGDRSHPDFCGDVILGIKEFNNCETVHNTKINIKELITNYFPTVNIQEIALSAYMHWEFGTLNQAYLVPNLQDRYKNYVKTFIKYALKVGYRLDKIIKDRKNIAIELLTELKLCILVACADITAGTNIRLKEDYEEIILPQIYPAYDPWVLFGMDKKYIEYRNGLIDYFMNNIDKIYINQDFD